MNGYGVVKVHLTTRRTSREKVESFCLSTFFLTQSPFYKARFEKFLSAMQYRQEFLANHSINIDFIIRICIIVVDYYTLSLIHI